MMDAAQAAARLREQKARILQIWEARVREVLPPAKQIDAPALRDALPDLLDRLAVELSSAPSSQAAGLRASESEKQAAAEHGEQRARMDQYSLDQVISEYQVLRHVVLEALEEEEPLAAAARESINDHLMEAVRHAASEFARLREEERAHSQEVVRRATEELDRRVRSRIAELHLSEGRFRNMVETVKDFAIFSLTPEGYITDWNAGCVRMKGYDPQEAIGQHYSILYPEEGRRRDEPANHLRTAAIEGRFRGEGLRMRKNGDIFLADVAITPMYEDRELAGFTKVVQDLTERNLLIQERDLSRTLAARMSFEVEDHERFVAALTHDLRSPLSVAKMTAELIRDSPGTSDRPRAWAVRIAEAVDRADKMISDLLDASRLHAGEALPLRIERCDLQAIASDVCSELSSPQRNPFAIEAEGATMGWWDPGGLRRVLENLLMNGVKYGERGTPITVSIRPVDDRILLAVHNHGTIIPAEEQAKLFMPFQRSAMAQRSGTPGWGIGLAVVEGIVRAHGGVVKVESYPQQGTTFTVDLPIDARRASGLPAPASAEGAAQ